MTARRPAADWRAVRLTDRSVRVEVLALAAADLLAPALRFVLLRGWVFGRR